MIREINLHGLWSFALDKENIGIRDKWYRYPRTFNDTIYLPTTLSEAKKTPLVHDRPTGYLADPYHYTGFAWYAKEFSIDHDLMQQDVLLVLERTRISHVWINGKDCGAQNSLCTSHSYDITKYVQTGVNQLVILVDNKNYPVSGGHMTSPDTQTNWNGILGQISLEFVPKIRLTDIQLYPSITDACVQVRAVFLGNNCKIKAFIQNGSKDYAVQSFDICSTNVEFTYKVNAPITPWSEHSPVIYTMVVELYDGVKLLDTYLEQFGFRDFRARNNKFVLNEEEVYLRGKHDGLLFPKTGYAPMEVSEWLSVMEAAKRYGINHYRFHTCCPPRAAFIAADMLGIYMEPELPFWGTITNEGDESHDENAQKYLIEEGFRILKEFGNHPSFMMFSLGNELWGSHERLNSYLKNYKLADNRRLYTQGSNNFQFVPAILEEDDFHVGVRFSRERLFRGSYAMCDAPLGKIQAAMPSTDYDYDEMIRPKSIGNEVSKNGEIQIQHGTGVKTVTVKAGQELYPMIPVVSHEIGQYNMYPDYREIDRYTGVLKAYNFEIFKERLHQAGMSHRAHDFFRASGHFAVQCYQLELEAALRSKELAGFQILDLQDFTGQGTALVGVLNSMMESKGLISESDWRLFCSETVLLARLPSFVFRSDDIANIDVQIYHYGKTELSNCTLSVSLIESGLVLDCANFSVEGGIKSGLFDLATYTLKIPTVTQPKKLILRLNLMKKFVKEYSIWVYPQIKIKSPQRTVLATDCGTMLKAVEKGHNVLYVAQDSACFPSIEGTYCTDFWNYTMFSIISKERKKPEPIGTLGLLIDKQHPALSSFPSEYYTTPQWYDIIESSRSLIMDNVALDPIVQTIDNVERNHRLGLIWEAQVGGSSLLICTSDLISQAQSAPAQQLLSSLLEYVESSQFKPKNKLDFKDLSHLLESIN